MRPFNLQLHTPLRSTFFEYAGRRYMLFACRESRKPRVFALGTAFLLVGAFHFHNVLHAWSRRSISITDSVLIRSERAHQMMLAVGFFQRDPLRLQLVERCDPDRQQVHRITSMVHKAFEAVHCTCGQDFIIIG